MTHLVTGYAGYEHIQSEDDGAFNAAFFGGGQYVMAFGNQFEGSIVDNNTVRILDGDGLMYGRHFRIKPNTYEDVTITTGTAGTNRTDLIVMTYKKNENDGTEQVYLEVIMGAESENQAVTPEYTDGNILEGATFNQMPLYKVTVSGVVLQDIEPLFDIIKTYKDLADEANAEFVKSCETHLNSLAVLDTMEEIEANTQDKQIAGALALKELEVTLGKSVADGKALLANTISYYGTPTASDATFETIDANLRTELTNTYNEGVAATKKGTATAAQVLQGYTFTNANGVELAGSMPWRGSWTSGTDGVTSGNVPIPAGCHDGKGYVNCNGAYVAGIAAGRNMAYATLSQAVTVPAQGTVSVTFKFAFGTRIVGIAGWGCNLTSCTLTGASISGNTLTLTFATTNYGITTGTVAVGCYGY